MEKVTDISRESVMAECQELLHYAADPIAETITKRDAIDIAAKLTLLLDRVDELERERSKCEKCLHVFLFDNLGCPCPHCMIEELQNAVSDR